MFYRRTYLARKLVYLGILFVIPLLKSCTGGNPYDIVQRGSEIDPLQFQDTGSRTHQEHTIYSTIDIDQEIFTGTTYPDQLLVFPDTCSDAASCQRSILTPVSQIATSKFDAPNQADELLRRSNPTYDAYPYSMSDTSSIEVVSYLAEKGRAYAPLAIDQDQIKSDMLDGIAAEQYLKMLVKELEQEELNSGCFNVLPNELLLKILRYIKVPDILSCLRLNSHFFEVITDYCFTGHQVSWRLLKPVDFGLLNFKRSKIRGILGFSFYHLITKVKNLPAFLWPYISYTKVEKLVFTQNKFENNIQLVLLADYLRNASNLRRIKLKENKFKLDRDAVNALVGLLPSLPNLEEMDVWDNNFDHKTTAEKLVDGLKSSTSLKKLRLVREHNFISSEVFLRLSDLFPQLEQLDLDLSEDYELGDEKLSKYIDSLARACNLQSLKFNSICLDLEQVQSLAKALSQLSKLKELEIKIEDLESKEVAVLIDSLQQLTNLEKLDLSYCDLSADALRSLIAILPRLNNFKSLNVFTGSIGKFLDSNSADKEVISLFESLQRKSNLRELVLGDNRLNLPAIGALTQLLQTLPNLRILNLAATELTDESISLLAEGLQGSTNLKKINLSNGLLYSYQNSIELAGLEALANVLQHLSKLKEFNAAYLTLNAEEAILLAGSLQHLTDLKRIYLTFFLDYDSTIVEALANLLKYLPKLEKLELVTDLYPTDEMVELLLNASENTKTEIIWRAQDKNLYAKISLMQSFPTIRWA